MRAARGFASGAALALLGLTGVAHAQRPADTTRAAAYVRDAGPGVVGRLLREALARPNVVVMPADTGIVLGRGTDVATTLVVLRGPARLEGRVRGDFIVLGDLVLRPGAVVEGRAIAIGGEILNSSLAAVRGERLVFRDVGFAVAAERPETYALDYRSLERHPVPIVSLPGAFGVRPPGYDRIDGLSIALGPEIALDTGRVLIDPTVTYRSHLGAVDPAVDVTWQPRRRVTVTARAARETRTDEAWIRGDLVNAVTSFFAGSDVRNYHRVDRGEATIAREWETTSGYVTPFIGGLAERAWSVARDSSARSAPYSVLGRTDREEGMLRPNPAVSGGRIVSALGGVRLRVLAGPVVAAATVRAEVPFGVPDGARRFVQFTGDGQIAFPTFRTQHFDAFAHFVGSSGGPVPSQRYAYVGGSGTIPTMGLLEQGGDELLWLESRYAIPVTAIRLPFAGSPTVTLRHIVGGAGVSRLPDLTQNVGIRLALAALRIDYVIDPAHTGRHDFGVGVGLR
ncbi:MAG: hypothetical protein JO180_10340 [Gemmatirosa sp.]|nr:hypothetical protein [Gemmatirosa sp.]